MDECPSCKDLRSNILELIKLLMQVLRKLG